MKIGSNLLAGYLLVLPLLFGSHALLHKEHDQSSDKPIITHSLEQVSCSICDACQDQNALAEVVTAGKKYCNTYATANSYSFEFVANARSLQLRGPPQLARLPSLPKSTDQGV